MINIDDVQKAAQSINEGKNEFKENVTYVVGPIDKLADDIENLRRAVTRDNLKDSKKAMKILKDKINKIEKLLV